MVPWEDDEDFAQQPQEKRNMSNNKTKGTVGPVTMASGAGSGLVGPISVLIVFALGAMGLDVDPEVAAAIAAVIGTIATFIAGKYVSPDTALQFQLHRKDLQQQSKREQNEYDPNMGGKPSNQV